MEENVKYNVDTTQGVNSLTALRNELKAAKAEMLGAEEGSAQYTAALNKAAAANFKLKEANEQIEASAADVGVVISNTSAVLGGMVGAINGVKAVSALLGTENEMLEKTFVQLQAGMALVQGLNGIDGMMKGFKNLGTIIKSSTAITKVWNFVLGLNPVLLIATGVVALTGAIIGLVSWMGKSNTAELESIKLKRQQKEQTDKLLLSIQGENKELEHQIKLKKIQGASDIELLKIQKEWADKKWEELRKSKASLGNNYDEIDKINKQMLSLKEMSANKEIEIELALEIEKKNIKDKRAKTREDELKKIEDNDKALINKYYTERELLTKDYEEKLTLYDKYNKDTSRLTADYFKNLQILDDEEKQRKLDKDKEYKDALIAAEEEYQANVTEYIKNETQKRIEYAQAELDHKKAMSDATMNIGAGLIAFARVFADKNKALQKAVVVADGALSIAKIITSTMSANAAVTAKYALIPGGGALAAAEITLNKISAGIGAATTIAATAKALQALGGGGGGGISAPSVGGGGGSRISAPQITDRLTPVRNVNTPTEIDLQRQPVKAYILESDLQKSRLNTENKTKETEF